MSAVVGIGEKFIIMSNSSWIGVIGDALLVAQSYSLSPIELKFIESLQQETEGFFPGYCPEFDSLFKSIEEKKFWCKCFRDVGRWLCLGKISHDYDDTSPAQRIFHTHWCAELLSDLIRKEDITWIVDDEDGLIRQRNFAKLFG